MIEIKFEKKLPYILCILFCLIISGKCMVTHILFFFFLIPVTTAEIYL